MDRWEVREEFPDWEDLPESDEERKAVYEEMYSSLRSSIGSCNQWKSLVEFKSRMRDAPKCSRCGINPKCGELSVCGPCYSLGGIGAPSELQIIDMMRDIINADDPSELIAKAKKDMSYLFQNLDQMRSK